jgi:hypothetical protein
VWVSGPQSLRCPRPRDRPRSGGISTHILRGGSRLALRSVVAVSASPGTRQRISRQRSVRPTVPGDNAPSEAMVVVIIGNFEIEPTLLMRTAKTALPIRCFYALSRRFLNRVRRFNSCRGHPFPGLRASTEARFCSRASPM